MKLGDIVTLRFDGYAPDSIYIWPEHVRGHSTGNFSMADIAIVVGFPSATGQYVKIATSTGLVGLLLSDPLQVVEGT